MIYKCRICLAAYPPVVPQAGGRGGDELFPAQHGAQPGPGASYIPQILYS